MSGSADRTFRPRNRPPHGRCSGAGAALAAPFSASRAAGELDLPASRGCCAAAATPATAALQRRLRAREAAPCESARGRAGAAARGYRIYRGQSRTLEGGSLRARYRICWVPRRSFPGVGAPRLNYGLVIAAGSAHDRAGVLRGRVPCGGRGGGSGGRARPGHPPPCGGAAVPLPAVRPDLLAAAQPGAAPEGTRRVGPRGCLRVPRVRQGLQRQAQPRDAEWAGSYDPVGAGPIWTWRPGMGCRGGLAGTAPGHEGTSSKKTCLKRCTAVTSGGDWLETGIGGRFQALVDRFPRPGGNRSWGRPHPGCLATGPHCLPLVVGCCLCGELASLPPPGPPLG
ncbi:uncharacterized protein LOC112620139 isoform X1 [Theropithecus gelada]|uniref:uncharacterized protein LOC112620139 isoform X1 n=1 Tax=Theropithecus gelada TaxID=9565 RepID=UPI000DC160E6|nr:uncharacterized protein LOC112620139 isoform X1 [Theropithecus gelada]